MPSKALLKEPLPSNLPVISVCKSCNSSFSPDEEYTAAFLSTVLSGTTDPAHQVTRAGARILAGNLKLCRLIERSKTQYRTVGGETKIAWKPEATRINRIAVKNARGHAFYETGEPHFAEPVSVWSCPLLSLSEEEIQRFEGRLTEPAFSAWPEVGSRLMTRLVTGEGLVNGWIVVQEGVYRYSINQMDQTVVRSVLHEYLATEVRWRDND